MKYVAAFSIELADIRTYVGDWVAGFLLYPLQLGALWIIWSTLYRISATGTLGSYSVKDLVAYYFGLLILSRVVGSVMGTEYRVWNDVMRGDLNQYLVRPLSYPLYQLARSLSKAVINLMLGGAILAVYLGLSQGHLNWPAFGEFLLVAVMGVTVYFEVWFLFGMLSFRMERIFGIRDIGWTLVMLMGGAVIPLDLLPGWLGQLAQLLPIQYVYYVPLASLLDRPGGVTALSLGVILAWVAGLFFVIRLLWPRAVRIYEAPGG